MNITRLFYIYSFVYLTFLFLDFFFFKKDDTICYDFYFAGLFVLLALFLFNEYRINKELFKSWVKPSNIFLLSYIIVNFQIIISTWLLYETISTYLGTSKYSGYIGKVLYCGLIGVSFYLLGYSCKKKVFHIVSPQNKTIYLNIHKWALLSIVSFILFVINIDLINFLTGMDYEGSGAANRETPSFAIWETLFDTFMTITVTSTTIRCLNENNKTLLGYLKAYPFYFLISVILYIALRLVSGDRGPVIYTGLMFFYSYLLVSQKKIKLSIVMLFIIIGAFVMTLLNSVRSYRNPNQSFVERVSRGFSDLEDEREVKSVSPFTYELSKSVNCNFIAVHDIDENVTNYKYGLYNICEILSAIPGSNRITTELFNLNIYRTTTSEYVTISFFGKNYLIGLGTTVITDFYLDYGIWGVIIGMFVLGLVYRRVDENLVFGSVSSFMAIVFFLKFSSMSVYIPRASFSFVLCRVLYVMIIFSIINTLFNLFRFRKSTC